MNLCDSGHEEVCYEGRSCPACALLEENKGLQDKIDELNDTINDLNNGG